MDDNQIEVEIRVIDDDGNEDKMCKKYNITATDNGVDAYFMYECMLYDKVRETRGLYNSGVEIEIVE